MISDHGLVHSWGASLFDGSSCVGYDSGSSNNSVFVTDPGSVWKNHSAVYVGFSGCGNSLVISNGGRVVSGPSEFLDVSGEVGVNSGSSNNSVLVTDPDSV
ncbi:MAG TPA: hypothetical protein VL171_06820 [Verrucomicrobiae bacterium]|nr:hypothetical protein [Verrucomicrobiae bacterium]